MPHVSGGVIFSTTNIVLGAAIIYMLIREPHGLHHRWNLMKAASGSGPTRAPEAIGRPAGAAGRRVFEMGHDPETGDPDEDI